MELFNEATIIFLLDVLLVFSDVLNQGNPEDNSFGTTPNLELSRNYNGLLYIGLLLGNITTHCIMLLIGQGKRVKGLCIKKYTQYKSNASKEKAF